VVGWFFGFWEELIYFDAYAAYEWESFCNAVCLLVQCGLVWGCGFGTSF
jgi:hypothetical protein